MNKPITFETIQNIILRMRIMTVACIFSKAGRNREEAITRIVSLCQQEAFCSLHATITVGELDEILDLAYGEEEVS